MRIAFIGASHWHLPLYLDPSLEIPGVSLAGVSDPDANVVAALGARLGCPTDSDFRALCRRTKPDFVVALGRHVDMAEEAEFLIEEGIPFAIEKPCGLDAAQVERIARLAEARGAFAAVPLVFRNGDFLALLREEAAAEGVQSMTFRFIAGFPSRYQQAGCDWMLDPGPSGGGCTINLAVHFFDICRLLWGPEVRPIAAAMSNAAWGHPIEDYSVVTFGRTGSELCLVETGYLYPGPTGTFDMHFAIRTPRRYIIAQDPETVELLDPSGRREVRRVHTTNVAHYRTFMHDVLERVRRGAAPLAGLGDMVPVMRMVDEAYALAARSGPFSPRPAAAAR